MVFTLMSFSPAILFYALTRLADRPRRTLESVVCSTAAWSRSSAGLDGPLPAGAGAQLAGPGGVPDPTHRRGKLLISN
jgi:hypothetical protein